MGFEVKAEEMGVSVVYRKPPNGWWGCWDPDRRRILVHPGLGYVQRRSTAWHELGHAHYDHVGVSAKNEAQASVWAARHMIRPAAFIDAARVTDDLLSIAHHLQVMPDDVRAWQQSLTVEQIIYLRKEINGHAD